MKNFILLIWLAVSFFVLSALSFAAETDVDRLLDLLVEKGVVTKDDAVGFRADLAVKKQEEKETQKEFTVISGKPIKICLKEFQKFICANLRIPNQLSQQTFPYGFM